MSYSVYTTKTLNFHQSLLLMFYLCLHAVFNKERLQKSKSQLKTLLKLKEATLTQKTLYRHLFPQHKRKTMSGNWKI